MQILMLALGEFYEDMGPDITYLEPPTLIAAFTKMFQELTDHVRKRDTFAEEWLAERRSRTGGKLPRR